jgi:c-di-GMP-binding flagellar brake protein YcgR
VCNNKYDTRRLVIFTSRAELSSGREHCDINNGKTHHYAIKVENQRRETVIIKASTHAKYHCVEFPNTATWLADFSAAGQQITSERAQTNVTQASRQHDQIITSLEYSWDDPFVAEEPPIPLQIQVNL